MSDLSIEALTAVFNAGVESCPYQAIEVAKGYGIRSVLAALAEAAGDPEALGRVALDAWCDGEGRASGEPRVNLTWENATRRERACFTAEAQAVAAAAVAGVREREVAPLRRAVEKALHDVESVLTCGFEWNEAEKTLVNVSERLEAALGGGDRGR